MENSTASPPNLFFTTGASSVPVTTYEKEILLTTTTGQPVQYTVRAYPNQKLDIELGDAPSNGFIEFTSHRSFSYQSSPSYQGKDSFSFILNHGAGHTTIIPFTISIHGAQQEETNRTKKSKMKAAKPTASTFLFKTSPGQKLVKDIPLEENNDESYTVSLKKPAVHGHSNVYVDGTFEYTPPSHFSGTDTFQIAQCFSDGVQKDIPIQVLVVKPLAKKNEQQKKGKRE